MVVTVGETTKLPPLVELPMEVPPVETVYQSIVYPVAVAERLEESPEHIVDGVADALMGLGGLPTTIAPETLLEPCYMHLKPRNNNIMFR